jgi:uncharacterized protein YbbK (DUF523 family)
MWSGMDRAAIEAVLGKGVRWVEDEDTSDVTYLFDKSIREGLDVTEQTQLDALIVLYESGR